MKKLKIMLLIFCANFVFNNSFAGGGGGPYYRWSHARPLGNRINKLHILPNNHIMMFANGGMFGSSLDGGNNWFITNKAAGTPTQFQYDLYGGHFFDGNNIIAVGDKATLSRSFDGGRNWLIIQTGLPDFITFLDVEFFNASFGYATGTTGTIIRTLDGGSSWQNVSPGGSSQINKIFIQDLNTAYAAGQNGRIYRTLNGGLNWVLLTTGSSLPLTDVVFSDLNTGIAIGASGRIIRTINAGINWLNSNAGAPFVNYSDLIYHNGEFYAVGGSSSIIKSVNLGASWIPITILASGQNATGQMLAIDKLGSQILVGGASGILNYSPDNGTTWSALGNKIYNGNLLDIAFKNNSNDIYAAGSFFPSQANSAVMYSANFGLTWSNSRGNPITTNMNTINHVPSGLYVGGGQGIIYESEDLGNTWNQLATGTNSTIYGSYFPDDGSYFPGNNFPAVSDYGVTSIITNGQSITGWFVGDSGLILKTTNGGDNFIFQNAGSNSWRAVYFVDENTGWVAGTPTALMKTINGGTNWTAQNTGFNIITEIKMLDSQTGFVSGGDINFLAALKKTINGGDNWTDVSVPANFYYIVTFDVKDNGQSIIIADPLSGHTALTSNGGNNWTTIFSGSGAINKIRYDYNGDAWLVGSSGNIMKLVDSSSFTLDLTAFFSEGFYNPSTNIIIPDTQKVTLRNVNSPYTKVDSAKKLVDNSGNSTYNFSNAVNGVPYYLVLNHRNSVETWSNTGVSFASGAASYNFSTSQSQAFGNNMKQIDTSPNRWGIYGGEVNQDGIVDGTDGALIDNDASNFVTGYVVTDVTGDDVVDGSDAAIADNNAFNFVMKVTP